MWVQICFKNRAKDEIDGVEGFYKKFGLGIIRIPEWLLKIFISIVTLFSWLFFLGFILWVI